MSFISQPSSIRAAPVKVHQPPPPSVAMGLLEHDKALTALRGLRDAALADVQRQFEAEERKLKRAFDANPGMYAIHCLFAFLNFRRSVMLRRYVAGSVFKAGFNAQAYMNGQGRETDGDEEEEEEAPTSPVAEKKRPASAAKTAASPTHAAAATPAVATSPVTGAAGGAQANKPKKAGGDLTLLRNEKMCRRYLTLHHRVPLLLDLISLSCVL
jgi:hypothetical protein